MKITCPECGESRQYPPSILKKLRSPVCRKCLHGRKPKVICSKCGKERYHGRPSIGLKLKSTLCRECVIKEQSAAWVVIRCPHCGRERRMSPATAKLHVTQTCYKCPRYTPTPIPETFDAGYIFGVILGDGYLCVKKTKQGSRAFGMKLGVTDPSFAAKFAAHVEACLGVRPWQKSYTRMRKGNPEIGMPAKDVTEHIVLVSSREWYDKIAPVKLERNFDIVRGMGLEFRKGFLQGMLDSEGYVSLRYEYTDIAGKDISLLETVAEVAREIGYKAKLYGPYPYARGVAHLRINACLDKTTVKSGK